MNAPQVTYEVFYTGKNITGDILPYVISFTYTDKSESESDELEITLEDVDGLWRNDWYPKKGDQISANILSEGKKLECGSFTIDEISCSGGDSGNTFTIKALATGIDKTVRTKVSYAHENKTLREIINTVASRHQLKVEGSIENIRIKRVTQHRETDLAFLKKLSDEYGYVFSIRGNTLTFTNIFELENKTPALALGMYELANWSFTDKTSETYSKVKVTYYSQKHKRTFESEQAESRQAFQNAKTDTLHIKIRVENQQQAEAKSKVALYRANSAQQKGNFSTIGNFLVLAGNNCEMVGLGEFSGIYYISSSTHSISKDSGYTTSAEVKRVALVGKEKRKQRKDGNI